MEIIVSQQMKADCFDHGEVADWQDSYDGYKAVGRHIDEYPVCKGIVIATRVERRKE